jgi:hypothetical protein
MAYIKGGLYALQILGFSVLHKLHKITTGVSKETSKNLTLLFNIAATNLCRSPPVDISSYCSLRGPNPTLPSLDKKYSTASLRNICTTDTSSQTKNQTLHSTNYTSNMPGLEGNSHSSGSSSGGKRSGKGSKGGSGGGGGGSSNGGGKGNSGGSSSSGGSKSGGGKKGGGSGRDSWEEAAREREMRP